MARVEFDALLEGNADTGGAFVVLPGDVRETFGRARLAVRVTIGDHTYRSTVAVYGGLTFIGVNRAQRAAASLTLGDTMHVLVESDGAPRVVDVPADLAAAIAADAAVAVHFEAMAYTHRLEYMRWIEAAKRPETRVRRIASAVERIRASKPAG